MDYYEEKIQPLIVDIERRIPYCNMCDNGFINENYDENNHSLTVKKCECLKRRIRYKNYINSGIPEFYWEFEDVKFKEFPTVIKNKLIKNDMNCIFLGSSFSGKTVTATYILMKKLEMGYTGFWWKHSNLLQLFEKARFDNELYNYLYSTLSRDIIVIDDLGWTNIRDENFVVTQTMRVIRGIFENNNIFLMTTNYPKKEIKEKYGEPLTNTIFHKDNMAIVLKESYK